MRGIFGRAIGFVLGLTLAIAGRQAWTAERLSVAPANSTSGDESLAHYLLRSQCDKVCPGLSQCVELASLASTLRDQGEGNDRGLKWNPTAKTSPVSLNAAETGSGANNSSGTPVESIITGLAAVTGTEGEVVPINFMYVRFSKSFLQSYICDRYQRTTPVYDCILGAAVRGTSYTDAHTELDLVHNSQQAQAKLRFKGTIWFTTTSYKGPVQIYSQGATAFVSEKGLWFDGINILQTEPVTRADTQTTTTGISTCLPRLRGRIALRIASRREGESHQLAESIATQRNAIKVATAFNSEVKRETSTFTGLLRTQYAQLPFDEKFAITDVRSSSEPNRLQIVVLCSAREAAITVPEPPALADFPDVEVHIHTSLVRKALLDSQLRMTLEAAIRRLVEQPLASAVGSMAAKQEPPKELKVDWSAGAGSPWLSLSWHANEKSLQ